MCIFPKLFSLKSTLPSRAYLDWTHCLPLAKPITMTRHCPLLQDLMVHSPPLFTNPLYHDINISQLCMSWARVPVTMHSCWVRVSKNSHACETQWKHWVGIKSSLLAQYIQQETLDTKNNKGKGRREFIVGTCLLCGSVCTGDVYDGRLV